MLYLYFIKQTQTAAMQNEQDLKQIGFRPTPNQKIFNGEYFYRGRNQIFTARVNDDKPAYVELYIVGDIDSRPLSDRRGYRFRRPVKHCVSDGSVDKAIKKYDLPSDKLQFVIGGCMVIA